MNLTRAFEQLKLTGLHSKIYETILKHGQLTILELAKSTKIPRSTCYEYLPDLVDLGLISMQKQGKSSILKAETPEKLISYLELRAKEINYEYHFLLSHKKELLAEFLKYRAEQPVKIIQGLRYLNKILPALILPHEEILVFSHGSVIKVASLEYYQEFFDFKSAFKNKELKTKELLEFNNISQEYRNRTYGEQQKIQLFEQEVLPEINRTDKIITSNSILVIQPSKEKIMLTNDPGLAAMEKRYFLLLWQVLIKQTSQF